MEQASLCGVVLNGGGSTRMGSDKSELPLEGMSALERITKTLSALTPTVVINRKEPHSVYTTIKDRHKDAGPLSGLHAVMAERVENWYLLSACDTPFIQKEVLRYLLEFCINPYDAVVPVYEGRLHPLSGIYHRRAFLDLDDYLKEGGRKVQGFLEKIKTRKVDNFKHFPRQTLREHFFNMNTPEDYKSAVELLKNRTR